MTHEIAAEIFEQEERKAHGTLSLLTPAKKSNSREKLTKVCRRCGKRVHIRLKRCPHCGSSEFN